jgi:hypothetical protein
MKKTGVPGTMGGKESAAPVFEIILRQMLSTRIILLT